MANAFDQFDAPAEDAAKGNPFDRFDGEQISASRSALHGVGKGATLNWDEEIGALLDAPVASLFDGSFSQKYNEALQRRQEMNKQAREANPTTFMAGEIGGMVLSPAAKVIGAGKAVATAPSLLGRMGQRFVAAAPGNAALGAVYGAGGMATWPTGRAMPSLAASVAALLAARWAQCCRGALPFLRPAMPLQRHPNGLA
jgi:hypothetical protein